MLLLERQYIVKNSSSHDTACKFKLNSNAENKKQMFDGY